MSVQVNQFPRNISIPIKDPFIEQDLSSRKVVGPALLALGTIALAFAFVAIVARRTPNVSGSLKAFTKIPPYGAFLLGLGGTSMALFGAMSLGSYFVWREGSKEKGAFVKGQIELLKKAVAQKEESLEKIQKEFEANFAELESKEGRAKVIEARDVLSPSYRSKFSSWKREQLKDGYFKAVEELVQHERALEGLERRLALVDGSSDEGKALKSFIEEHAKLNRKEKIEELRVRVESALDQVPAFVEKLCDEGLAHEKAYVTAFRDQEAAFTQMRNNYKARHSVLSQNEEEFIKRLDAVAAQLNFRDTKTFAWVNLADLYEDGLNSTVPKFGTPSEYTTKIARLKEKMEQVSMRMATLISEYESG